MILKPDAQVVHDFVNQQFVMSIDNLDVVTKYRLVDDKTIEFYSTHTPKSLRGHGYAAKLVNHALDYAAQKAYKIIPTCWYVNKIMIDRQNRTI